jgi:hypothetical protein
MDYVDGEVLLARLIRQNETFGEKLNFFSEPNEQIQVGIWNHEKNRILTPHIHCEFDRNIVRTGEVLFVISGSIHCDIYSNSMELMDEFEMFQGDILISIAGGHGYKILEDDTRVFEVKTGPYFGPEIDRFQIESLCTFQVNKKQDR